jgi:hypothetical protein
LPSNVRLRTLERIPCAFPIAHPIVAHGQRRQSSAKLSLPPPPPNIGADGADTAQVSAAIISAWGKIEAALTPIIGKRGVAALYERSLYLARVHHPWLAAVPENIEARMDLPALAVVLARQNRSSAAAGGQAHLQALHELLCGLVGSSLAERLLASTPVNAFNGPAAQDPND